MADTKELLERARRQFPATEGVMDSLSRRRSRKHRHRRIGAGVLAIVVAGAGFAGLMRAFQEGETRVPASDIFADIHGWITYGDRDGIWAVDPANPEDPASQVRLSSMSGEPLDWSSDGSMLLIRARGDCDSFDPCGLFVLNTDGTSVRLTGNDEFVSGGSFTPDGLAVVYGGAVPPEGVGSSTHSGFFIVGSEGGRRRLLSATGSEPTDFPFVPTLSPDGTKIAYVLGNMEEDPRLWVMNADGTQAHPILDVPDDPTSGQDVNWVLHLEWSPDGRRLVFDAVRPSGEEGPTTVDLDWGELKLAGEVSSSIFVVSADGTDSTLLSRDGSNPHWSPDGSRISYSTGVSAALRVAGSPVVRSLVIAAADGSKVQEFACCASGAWNPLSPTVGAPTELGEEAAVETTETSRGSAKGDG